MCTRIYKETEDFDGEEKSDQSVNPVIRRDLWENQRNDHRVRQNRQFGCLPAKVLGADEGGCEALCERYSKVGVGSNHPLNPR